MPTYDQLAGDLLVAILRREAAVHGKVSVRHVARVTAIPKSTLAVKLRQLVDQNLIAREELARIVNVGRD
jgi:predicted transcriptional regulator